MRGAARKGGPYRDELLLTLILLAALPGALIGFSLRPAFGRTEFAWRKRGPGGAARRLLVALCIAGTIGAIVYSVSIAQSGRVTAEAFLPLVGLYLLLQSCACVTFLLLAMPGHPPWAKHVSGELRAGQEAGIAAAGWNAVVRDAHARTRRIYLRASSRSLTRWPHLHESLIGVVVKADHRRWIRRIVDKTIRKPSAWLTRSGLAVLPNPLPRLLLLAASGHGKTVAIVGMVLASLRRNDRVLLIDCKGSVRDANELEAEADALGKRVVRWPNQPLDLWRGDRHACVSIVMAMLPPHDYWSVVCESVLVAVSEQAGPWRSTEELLARLQRPAKHVRDTATLGTVTQKVSGGVPAHLAVHQIVHARLAGIASLIDGGPDSWSIDNEDIDLIIISADIGADVQLAAALTGLIAALNSYRVHGRVTNARPLLLAIDECQVLLGLPRPPDLAWLAEQVRSQNIGMILATQSVAGLGTSARRLLGAGMDLLAGRLDDPTEIVQLAGTRLRPEMGWQKKKGRFTAIATARTQHAHRLDPNIQRTLPQWVWSLQSRGRQAYLLIPPVSRLRPPPGINPPKAKRRSVTSG